jgi:hypothetical protein
MVIPTHRRHYERDNVRHDAMSLRGNGIHSVAVLYGVVDSMDTPSPGTVAPYGSARGICRRLSERDKYFEAERASGTCSRAAELALALLTDEIRR